MSLAIIVLILTFMLSLTITGLVQFAYAFVNIVSPPKDEAVPAGSNLQISGTSDDNAQFNCKVLIIVNDKRPYQETTPAGPAGPTDYSQWTFTVTPQYAEIEEGINTITSKATCDAGYESFLKQDPLTKEYVKFYSINVTGIPSTGGIGSEAPFILPAPNQDSEVGEEDETEEDGDGESTSDESLFG